MANSSLSNDEKQVIELKLVNLIHAIALRQYLILSLTSTFVELSLWPGCLPNPDKNESVLKAFASYAIKQHKQTVSNKPDSSILLVFKQAISDGIKSKESYALAVRLLVRG